MAVTDADARLLAGLELAAVRASQPARRRKHGTPGPAWVSTQAMGHAGQGRTHTNAPWLRPQGVSSFLGQGAVPIPREKFADSE